MKKSLFLLCLLLGMLGNCALVLAQPAQKLVNVVVSPDRIARRRKKSSLRYRFSRMRIC